MTWNRFRRLTGIDLVLFFLAFAAAPHHHINDLEDLLLDQRSDSGILVQTGGVPGSAGAPALNSCRLLRDISCLACFTRDFVSVASTPFQFLLVFAGRPLLPALRGSSALQPFAVEAPSRAPPRCR